MKNYRNSLILSLMLLSASFSAYACGDLDFHCRQREGEINIPLPQLPKMPELPKLPKLPDLPNFPFPLDPECRSDTCRAWNVMSDEAKRALDNLAREIGKTPQAMAECLQNVERCAKEILAAPAAAMARAYIAELDRQSHNKVRSFSPEFIALVAQHYEIDLNGVTYADNINTGHGMVLAFCNRIYFTREGNLWTDRAELRLVLHELEHLDQCQKRGPNTYLAEYILKGLVDIGKNGRLNIHDLHDFEAAANAKANSLLDSIWTKVQARGGPGKGGFPAGYTMQGCACRGMTNQYTAAEPRCVSQSVRLGFCQGFCPDGSVPYGYVCN